MRLKNFFLKLLIFSILILLQNISTLYSAEPNHCGLGLTFSESGKLLKDCKPYKAAGVNYFNAFYRVLKNPDDKSYVQGFEKLSKNSIPFVRMMASGFWPKDWELYFKDREKYFALLDDVVKTAERYNVGIIMSLFWKVSTLPDIVGEPVSAWGNPESKTIKFMKEYTKEIVSRYKNSPAIWGWEFGNEYNLLMDLPEKHLPQTAPQYGTPERRTQKDRLTYRDVLTAFIQFADTIREIDKNRIIITGNSIPRPSAYNLAFNGTWQKDTLSQFLYILELQNPKNFNTISIHLYPTTLNKYFADKNINSFKDLVSYANMVAEKGRRILFIGEFGVCSNHVKTKEEEKTFFSELVKAIQDIDVPLFALWVYDFDGQNQTCNVTFENDRAYQLLHVIMINKKYKKEAVRDARGTDFSGFSRWN